VFVVYWWAEPLSLVYSPTDFLLQGFIAFTIYPSYLLRILNVSLILKK
jgi:hypothetical protein